VRQEEDDNKTIAVKPTVVQDQPEETEGEKKENSGYCLN
jgi:hypothetical protein